MMNVAIEQEATLWMVDDIPARMFYAGRPWTVMGTPTRLRESIWSISSGHPQGLYGWRFQATGADGDVLVFDLYRAEDGWHVHHAYV